MMNGNANVSSELGFSIWVACLIVFETEWNEMKCVYCISQYIKFRILISIEMIIEWHPFPVPNQARQNETFVYRRWCSSLFNNSQTDFFFLVICVNKSDFEILRWYHFFGLQFSDEIVSMYVISFQKFIGGIPVCKCKRKFLLCVTNLYS